MKGRCGDRRDSVGLEGIVCGWRGSVAIEGTVWGWRGQCGNRRDSVGMETTAWGWKRQRGDGTGSVEMEGQRVDGGGGAVRGLHRAGGDFITQSITDSDRISGGQRSAQQPHQPPGTDPGGCGALPAIRAQKQGWDPPQEHSPSHIRPGDDSGGSLWGRNHPKVACFPSAWQGGCCHLLGRSPWYCKGV